jgi:predicted  nucleic acid-binding Zn-ribbon protein
MKKLILTTAVLFLGATAIHAQELRRADVPVEAAPQKQATHKEGVMEKANSLKELHGRLNEAIQTIDKQMASVGKEEQIRLSQEKEQLTMSVRAVEQSLGEVSSATDANMNEVMARAASVEKRGNELLSGVR